MSVKLAPYVWVRLEPQGSYFLSVVCDILSAVFFPMSVKLAPHVLVERARLSRCGSCWHDPFCQETDAVHPCMHCKNSSWTRRQGAKTGQSGAFQQKPYQCWDVPCVPRRQLQFSHGWAVTCIPADWTLTSRSRALWHWQHLPDSRWPTIHHTTWK